MIDEKIKYWIDISDSSRNFNCNKKVTNMVEREDTVLEVVKKFIQKLQQTKNIYAVVLFGSHAFGSPNRFSDIDVAVFYDEPIEDYFREIKELFKIRRQYSTDIEPIPFVKEDFINCSALDFAYEVINKGWIIYKEGRFLV